MNQDTRQEDDDARMKPVLLRLTMRWAMAWACLLLAVAPAAAIDIDQVEWGFDGKVVTHRFNVLSVLVNNPTPETFDGVLQLHKLIAAGQRIGAILSEPVYLAPYTSRWVQFYPYAMQDWEEYKLVWGRRSDEELTLPKPRMGEPATIILDDPQNLLSRRGVVTPFPEDLFPPTSTATDALGAVFIDYVPRWEESRRKAFLEWLNRGGFVHVLKGSDGEFPQFADELAVLNSPLERKRVGGGYVFRHQVDRQAVDKTFVESARKIEQQSFRQSGDELVDDIVVERGLATSQPQVGDDYLTGIANADWTILGNLKSMTNPHHNWGMIYGLAMVYSLSIFPGCYWLGRRRLDYRIVFGAMLLSVLMFSVAFGFVGRRGYGEATSVNSLVIVRPLEENLCDVTGWSATFVTNGGDYELTHAGEGRLYATAQVSEAVRGFIENGAEARFVADIPPFSSRPFTYRARVACPVPKLEVTRWRLGKQLYEFEFTHGENFPREVYGVYALYRDRVYTLKTGASKCVLGSRNQTVPSFLRLDDPNQLAATQSFGFDPFSDDSHSPDERFADLAVPLIARSLDVKEGDRMQDFTLLDDRVRVFIYAPLPEELYLQHDAFTRQQGRALYCIDVFDPESR